MSTPTNKPSPQHKPLHLRWGIIDDMSWVIFVAIRPVIEFFRTNFRKFVEICRSREYEGAQKVTLLKFLKISHAEQHCYAVRY